MAPVKFEEADYYKLRALISDAERFTVVLTVAQQRQAAACAARDVFVNQMAEKYGFDPMFTQSQENDTACEFSFS